MFRLDSKKAQQNALWTVATIVIVLIVLITTYTIYSDKYGTLIHATNCEGNGGVFAAKCDPKFSEEMQVFNDYKKGLKCCISNGFNPEEWDFFQAGGQSRNVIASSSTSFSLVTDPTWPYEKYVKDNSITMGTAMNAGKIYVFYGQADKEIQLDDEEKATISHVKNQPFSLKFLNTYYWSFIPGTSSGDFCVLEYYETETDKPIKVETFPRCSRDDSRMHEVNKLESTLKGMKFVFKIYSDEKAYTSKPEEPKRSKEVIVNIENIDCTKITKCDYGSLKDACVQDACDKFSNSCMFVNNKCKVNCTKLSLLPTLLGLCTEENGCKKEGLTCVELTTPSDVEELDCNIINECTDYKFNKHACESNICNLDELQCQYFENYGCYNTNPEPSVWEDYFCIEPSEETYNCTLYSYFDDRLTLCDTNPCRFNMPDGCQMDNLKGCIDVKTN